MGQTAEFYMATLDVLEESALNPRRHTDDRAFGELVESVKRHGVLTPLLVRPTAGKNLEIAAGHRRFRAAKKAGLSEVPVRLRPMGDVEFLEVLTIENLQREDLHPMDEAQSYHALMEKAHYDVDTLATKVGKSKSYIYQRLKLLDLAPALRTAFLKDTLTAGHAILLARLQSPQQLEVLGWLTRNARNGDDVPGVRSLNHYIHERILTDLTKAPFDTADATLVPSAGACGPCPFRAGNQPELFDDVKKGDICTAPSCFQEKARAQVERVAATLREKSDGGPKPVLVSEAYGAYHGEKRQKGVIYRGDQGGRGWREVRPDGCPHARPAVIAATNGTGSRKLGTILTVCTEPKCTKGDLYRSRSTAPALTKEDRARREKERAARVREDAKQEKAARARQAVIAAVVAKVPKALSSLELTALAGLLWQSCGMDGHFVAIAQGHGWVLPADKTKGPQHRIPGGLVIDETAAEEAIARMDALSASRFLVELVLTMDDVVPLYGDRGRKPGNLVATLAKRYRVDAKKVAAAAEKARVQTSAQKGDGA